MIKGYAKRGHTYEVKQPAQRYRELLEKFQRDGSTPQMGFLGEAAQPFGSHKVTFIDHVQLLMVWAEAGENLLPWLERWRGMTPQIRAVCEYLRKRNSTFAPTLDKILGFIDPGPLFRSGIDRR